MGGSAVAFRSENRVDNLLKNVWPLWKMYNSKLETPGYREELTEILKSCKLKTRNLAALELQPQGGAHEKEQRKVFLKKTV